MRKLLEADMRRIAAKILPWILLAASFVYMGVMATMDIDSSPDRAFFFIEKIRLGYGFVLIVMGFAALIGVYADEFKSMVMIGVIGRGMSREKFVIAKFLDMCMLALTMQILTVIYVMILKAALGVTLTPLESGFLALSFVTRFIDTVATVTMAAIFYFLSENAAVGMFAYLTFEIILPLILAFIMTMSKLSSFHPDRYYITGLTSYAFGDFIMGDHAGGILLILVALAVYVAGSIGITILIFRKKELEF